MKIKHTFSFLFLFLTINLFSQPAIVKYNFNEGSGTTIYDSSGTGSPYNLVIYNPSATSWSPVSLLVNSTTVINSPSVATKIIDSVMASNEITIELWLNPIQIRNDRILVLSQNSGEVNFQIETNPPRGYNFGLRTSANTGGTLDTTGISLELTHLIFTFKNDTSRIYKNGIEVASRNLGGDFSNWYNQSRLSLASYLNGTTPWRGIFYFAAIYNRALDSSEVVQNFLTGVPLEPPFIIEEPQNLITLDGLTATFKVNTFSNTPISYQWQRNGSDISGAIDSFYTTVVTLADSGDLYRVIVTNPDGSDTSLAAVLEVLEGSLSGCVPRMVHYYKLEELFSPYLDSFGFTNATSTNPPGSQTGIVGNAINFSNQEKIDIPDDNLSDWNGNESFSIQFWIKTSFVPSDNIVVVGRDDNTSNLHWWIGINSNGKASFQLKNKNGEGVRIGDDGLSVNDDVWHLITAVRNGSTNKNYLFVDGSIIDSATQVYNASFEGSASINIGYLNLTPFYYYTGSVDELAIINSALSQLDIQTHYNNGLAGTGYCYEIIAPTELNAEAQFTKVDLSWKDNSDDEDGFIVERALQDSAFVIIDSVEANDTSYIDENIADTTTYKYRVKAFNVIAESDYSNEVLVTTLLSTISAPGNLLASLNPQDTTNVNLSWDDNSSNELGFIIQRAIGDSISATVFDDIDSVAVDVTTYTDTTTSDTTTYTYRTYAYNADTVSAFSNLAEITTPLPVELTSFTANVVNGKILISWATATETNNAGFSLERSNDNIKFVELAFIEGNGTTTNTSTYSYKDNSVLSGKYYYRLKQIDFNGSFYYLKSIEADLGIPKEYSLNQNYPNPFNPSTTIRFALPINAEVNIKLYNTLGQEVADILRNELDAGIHETTFNASNLSSGVYFYRIEAKGIDGSVFNELKRMILLK